MSYINWSDSYSVNIQEIDKQHKGLVDLINNLHSAMLSGKSKLILADIISELIHYTDTHFKTEEALFEEYDFLRTKEHKKEHADFVAHVVQFKSEFDAGNVFLSIDVIKFLKNWLVKHILGSDKEYALFLNNQGVF